MEIYAAPKLFRYATALGNYNIKSFTYEINQHSVCLHTHTPHTHKTHTHTHTHTHTYRQTHIHTHTPHTHTYMHT